MSKLISISIDVTKINKERLIAGKKGTYLDLTIEVKDEKDQFDNDVAAWEGQSKEEREAKTNRNYLGNGRVVWSSDPKPEASSEVIKPSTVTEPGTQDDLPF